MTQTLFWIALAIVVVALVVIGWVGIIRDIRRGSWGCPHCGRSTCDRGCIERGED